MSLTKAPNDMLAQHGFGSGTGSKVRMGFCTYKNPTNNASTTSTSWTYPGVIAAGVTTCYGMCEFVEHGPRFKVNNPPLGTYIAVVESHTYQTGAAFYTDAYMSINEVTTATRGPNIAYSKRCLSSPMMRSATACTIVVVSSTLSLLDFQINFAQGGTAGNTTFIAAGWGLNMRLYFIPA